MGAALELAGLGLLVATAAVIWWPAALAVGGICCLWLAYEMEHAS